MTRIFLKAINAPALVLIVAIGVALQTSLFATYPFLYLQPDVVLIAVIWCALRRSFTEGGILTLILANITEIHSAAPQGVFLVAYMSVYLLVRLISRVFVIPQLVGLVMIALGASVFWKLELLGIVHLLGESSNQWRHTLVLLFPGAVVTGAASIWIFRWLERFDWLTHKNVRAQLLEEELQLEGEL